MVYAREQKRADIAEYRERFKEKLKTIDKAKLVFLDESGVNLNLTRRYGRAQGKARVRDYTPLNIPKSTTLLSSIRTDGTMIHKEFTGALNGQYFVKYIKEQLVPSLHKDDIVIIYSNFAIFFTILKTLKEFFVPLSVKYCLILFFNIFALPTYITISSLSNIKYTPGFSGIFLSSSSILNKNKPPVILIKIFILLL